MLRSDVTGEILMKTYLCGMPGGFMVIETFTCVMCVWCVVMEMKAYALCQPDLARLCRLNSMFLHMALCMLSSGELRVCACLILPCGFVYACM